MRLLLCTLALAGGCVFDGESRVANEGVGDEDGFAGCAIDEDCVAAASSCCGCPTFAQTAGDAADCDPIGCAPLECAPTEVFCDLGQCQLRCAEVVATASCESGFAVDEAGCTIDRCAPELESPECAVDSDCVQVPADCCGCAEGGRDTAVPGDSADAHLAGLDCADDSQCPGLDACDPDLAPTCLGGICRLVSASGMDVTPSVCGIPGAGSCPADAICVLNDPDASPGAGVCRSR